MMHKNKHEMPLTMVRTHHIAMRVHFKEGFTLIEVMVAIVILLVGLLGLMNLQITAIQVNEANKRLIIAKEVATGEIERVKLIGYTGLRTNTLLTTAMGYKASLGGLDSKYQISGIDTSCGSPFTYCVYKGVTVTKNINGRSVDYDHTLKLSVIANYLSYPVLERCEMNINWISGGKLKTLTFVFFNEYKP
ncbi:MAG: prepilin-type N-terminal cleavage/methylation domain-containing protein [Thermodesulfovibrionales bacterium]